MYSIFAYLFIASSTLTTGFIENQACSFFSSPVLDESLHQLWPQAGQAVRMMSWITILATVLWNVPSNFYVWELEVEIWWKSPEKIQDVGSAVVTQDTFGLNARA